MTLVGIIEIGRAGDVTICPDECLVVLAANFFQAFKNKEAVETPGQNNVATPY